MIAESTTGLRRERDVIYAGTTCSFINGYKLEVLTPLVLSLRSVTQTTNSTGHLHPYRTPSARYHFSLALRGGWPRQLASTRLHSRQGSIPTRTLSYAPTQTDTSTRPTRALHLVHKAFVPAQTPNGTHCMHAHLRLSILERTVRRSGTSLGLPHAVRARPISVLPSWSWYHLLPSRGQDWSRGLECRVACSRGGSCGGAAAASIAPTVNCSRTLSWNLAAQGSCRSFLGGWEVSWLGEWRAVVSTGRGSICRHERLQSVYVVRTQLTRCSVLAR
ncbi:hypothetical protein OH77DRAFT_1053849 [Trametes cingulata]|nr:hypothetical protein OH77DRAFT_1053849 [Trametes cingulata]